MQSIGVLLKNGGRRPSTATFSHKGRREVVVDGAFFAAALAPGAGFHPSRRMRGPLQHVTLS